MLLNGTLQDVSSCRCTVDLITTTTIIIIIIIIIIMNAILIALF